MQLAFEGCLFGRSHSSTVVLVECCNWFWWGAPPEPLNLIGVDPGNQKCRSARIWDNKHRALNAALYYIAEEIQESGRACLTKGEFATSSKCRTCMKSSLRNLSRLQLLSPTVLIKPREDRCHLISHFLKKCRSELPVVGNNKISS
jgi:hypothetical protein